MLQGESLGTVVVNTVTRDIVDTVDWSKLQWNVDGNGSTVMTFTEDDVVSAVVNDDGTTLTVTLSNAGQEQLHSLDGFGGTGSNADSIDVSGGLLHDGMSCPLPHRRRLPRWSCLMIRLRFWVALTSLVNLRRRKSLAEWPVMHLSRVIH